MRAQTIIVICALAAAGNANAQDAAQQAQSQRALQALQPIADQRNAAFDQLALCQGDVGALKAELAASKAELDKLKNPAPPKKD